MLRKCYVSTLALLLCYSVYGSAQQIPAKYRGLLKRNQVYTDYIHHYSKNDSSIKWVWKLQEKYQPYKTNYGSEFKELVHSLKSVVFVASPNGQWFIDPYAGADILLSKGKIVFDPDVDRGVDVYSFKDSTARRLVLSSGYGGGFVDWLDENNCFAIFTETIDNQNGVWTGQHYLALYGTLSDIVQLYKGPRVVVNLKLLKQNRYMSREDRKVLKKYPNIDNF